MYNRWAIIFSFFVVAKVSAVSGTDICKFPEQFFKLTF